MDFGHFFRLEKSRRDLLEQQRALEAGGEARLAEALRPALATAIETLRRLHDDEAVWEAGQHAVTALQGADLVQVREDYSRALPPLLSLFGYAFPPPPSAQQRVDETVSLLDGVGHGEATAEEVREARRQLGDLVMRADNLPREAPWKVAHTATEVNSLIHLGVDVVVGGGLGALGGALAGVAGGAVTGGVGPVAGFIVLGGIRRFKAVHAFESEAEAFIQANDRLTSMVFPATGAAAVQHLNQVLNLSVEPNCTDGFAALKVSANLDALIDISRRFVLDPQCITVSNQSSLLRQNDLPSHLLPLLRDVFDKADKARTERALDGRISLSSLTRLGELRNQLRELLTTSV